MSNLDGSCNGYDNISSIDSSVLNDVTNISDNVKKEIPGVSRSSEASNLLLELSGDYDVHFENLQYGQLSQGYATSLPPSPPLSPQLLSKNPLRTFCRSKKLPLYKDDRSNGNDNALGPQFYSASRFIVPHRTSFGEESKKPRGTGTFFHSPSSYLYNKRSFHKRGRNHAPETHRPIWRHARRNNITRREFSSSAECRHELLQSECLISSNADYHQSHFSLYATTQQTNCSHELWPAEHPVPCNRC